MYKTEYEYNGFIYKGFKGKGTILHKSEKPKCIFKYYAFNEYNVEALVDSFLYASHPFDLNDILDSSQFLLHNSKYIQYESYEKLLSPVFENELELKQFYHKDSHYNNFRGFLDYYWHILTNKFGVISTTAKEDNPLMWPHYTQEKGFQLEFRTVQLEESIVDKLDDGELIGIFPINYTENIRPIDVGEFSALTVPLMYATNIKSDYWKYEDEWRIIFSRSDMGVPFQKKGFSEHLDYRVKKENRYVYYDRTVIDGITVGMDYFNGNDFEIKRNRIEKSFLVKIRCDNLYYDTHIRFLNYIYENLNDRLYLSSVLVKNGSEEDSFIRRNRSKVNIEKIFNDTFVLKIKE